MSETPIPSGFPHHHIDPDAVAVVRRLQRAGHVTYFVGGCVRDLLLGNQPKDFDIATDARPEQLKDIFGRRCRIIGRRFRLAHIHAGTQVYEVATFRGTPEDQETEDGSDFVVRANTYGTPEQDARSRDFTVNGLFLDPVSGTIIDWVEGTADIFGHRLRTIGAADQRLPEDPVRLLRGIKFAARLGFELDDAILEIGREIAPLVAECATTRVTEEIFRISESGNSRRAYELLVELGVIEALIPEFLPFIDEGAPDREAVFAWLDALDRLTRANGAPSRSATFTLIAWPIVARIIERVEADGGRAEWGKIARNVVQDVAVRLGVPIRHRQVLRITADMMKRLSGADSRPPTRSQLRSRALPVALAVARMAFLITGTGREGYERWAADAEKLGVWGAPFEVRQGEQTSEEALPKGRKRNSRRRRPRRAKSKKPATPQPDPLADAGGACVC